MPRESQLLNHIYRRSADLAAAFPHVVVGPGDDCAVVAAPGHPGPSPTPLLLLKVDQLVSGRHFYPYPRTPIDLIARKAIARAVSDIAAMGGRPHAALAAATLPDDFPPPLADELFDALARWAIHFACPLVGGDIAIAPAGTPLVLGVTLLGISHPARAPVLRSGARPGDTVYVTGRLGGSLHSGRHLTFEPRLIEAHWLCDTLGDHLHAMMDISDGLGRDAARMAERSGGVRIELFAPNIPRHEGVESWRTAVGDGEDYELLFAAPSDTDVPPRCPATGTPITHIGRVVRPDRGAGCFVLADHGESCTAAGAPIDISELGWDHGRASSPTEPRP